MVTDKHQPRVQGYGRRVALTPDAGATYRRSSEMTAMGFARGGAGPVAGER
jgi:hypothetical protein